MWVVWAFWPGGRRGILLLLPLLSRVGFCEGKEGFDEEEKMSERLAAVEGDDVLLVVGGFLVGVVEEEEEAGLCEGL